MLTPHRVCGLDETFYRAGSANQLMEVTSDNFEPAMVKLEAALSSPQLSFMSFDEEMSGIGFAGVSFGEMNALGDRPCDRYAKMRRVASSFGLIQLGLTVWHQVGGELVAHPFNIYVFPVGESGNDVLLSPSAVDFLNRHGMSWSTWLQKGVSYMNEESERRAREEPVERRERMELSNDTDTAFCRRELERVASLQSGQSLELAANPNAGVRRYLYQEIELRHPTFITEKLPGFRIGVRVPTHGEATKAKEHRAREREAKLARDIGARRVFLAMRRACRAGTPIVGHNCWFDLLFLMQHMDAPLPETYAEWKRRAYSHFPNIYDTKVLAQRRDAYGSLQQLYSQVRAESNLKLRFAQGFAKYASGIGLEDGEERDIALPAVVYHEAGWDSYATGVLFAEMCRTTPNDDRPALNCLFVMRSQLNVCLSPSHNPYDDPLKWTPRFQVFHVSGLHSSDRARELFVDVNQHVFDSEKVWLVDARCRNPNVRLPPGVVVTPFQQHAKALAKRDARRFDDHHVDHPWWDWLRAKFANLSGVSDQYDDDDVAAELPRKRLRSTPGLNLARA